MMVGFPLLTVLAALVSLCGGVYDNSNAHRRARCSHERVLRKMLGADCSRMDLLNVPQVLKSDIEVLDMTYNRVREIYNTSFERYPSLKFLYLADNSISHIDAGAFDPLTDLEVLDLSLNSLHFVPEAFHSLTVLSKLSLDSNPFREVVFTKTLFSVQFLSLTSCKLKRLPGLSALPGLKHLNVSLNRLQTLDIHQVAPMCRLKELDLRGNPRMFDKEHCKCQVFAKWISMRTIKVWPDVPSICKNRTEGNMLFDDPSMCFTNETQLVLEEGDRTARSCETDVQRYGSGPLRLKTSMIWGLSVVGLCFLALVGFFGLYCMRKKQHINREADHSSEQLTKESHS